jgi:type IV pilus assembly protein PilC
MKFKYQAKNKQGELQVGYVEAAGRDAAITVLTSHDLFILSLVSADSTHWYDGIVRRFSGVRTKDLVIFARQFATLLSARLPLTEALKTLYNQTTHPELRRVTQQVSEDITSGLSFSQALERHKDVFPGFYISMIRSAEVIGNLEEVAGFLADYMEKEYELVTKARSAMIYPGIILGLFAVVGFIMVSFVFPQLGPVFEQSGVELPFYTQALLGIGTFFGTWWPLALLMVVFLGLVIVAYIETAEGKALWDELKLRFPLLKKVYLPLTLTRLSNAISMLLKGGVPMAQALEIAGQSVNNILYQDLLTDISDDIRQGTSLSAAIAKYPDYFPPLVSQMIVVGEATGQLDGMFARLASFYGRDADTTVANLVDLIQPTLMIVVGLLVGLLFASILIPLYRLTATIQ